MSNRKLLLMVLVDAFRHDYLRYTNFLRKLARRSFLGTFEEPFGFCPRAAYFGGLDPSQSGFTNVFWLDSANSPFSISRFMDLECIRSFPALQESARALIQRDARSKSSRFAANYVSTLAIPLQFLHLFDVAEKAAPWDPNVGYRSLFHALDDKGIPWFQCSWPGYDGLENPSDPEILEYASARLQGDQQFAFVHFNGLDGIGHADGPGSRKCVEAVRLLDSMVERLVSNCYPYYDDVDLIVFGDHGMVPVIRNFDIVKTLNDTGLIAGRDFYYFIDSTMVRFWCATRRARIVLENVLSPIKEGYFVDDRMKHALRIADCDPRNGELFFVANPGIQFFPNFFQSSGTPPKGMHGYDPGCPDNQGLFLMSRHDQSVPVKLNAVAATQIFHTCCDLLKLDNIEFSRNESILEQSHWMPEGSRYSVNGSPETDSIIQSQLDQIVSKIRHTAPNAKAAVLTGGFGRGEGSLLRSNGISRPLNDYDVLVACDEGFRPALKSAGSELASTLGMDYVDLGPLHPDWFDKLALTLFTFDLKYGSQTLWGDDTLLESVPVFAPAEIPLTEAYQLLQNRITGLLLGLKPNMLVSSEWTNSESAFLIHQISKAGIAIGDFHLITLGDYSSSYRQRLAKISGIGQALNLGDAERHLLALCYGFKLEPDYQKLSPPAWHFSQLLPFIKESVTAALGQLTASAGEGLSILELLARWTSHSDPTLGQEITALRASLILLFFSIEQGFVLNQGMLREALSRCRCIIDRQHADHLEPLTGLELYTELRSFLLQKWEAQCH